MEKFSKFINESKFTRFDDADDRNRMQQNMHDFVMSMLDITQGNDQFIDQIEGLISGLSWFAYDFADGNEGLAPLKPTKEKAIRAFVKGLDSLSPLLKKCKQVEAFNLMA